jgi:hypothetical protein
MARKKNVHRAKQVKGIEKCINHKTWRSKKQDEHIMLPGNSLCIWTDKEQVFFILYLP